MPPPAPPAQVVYGQKRHGYIDSLIYWRDPRASAGVLATGLGFFALTIVFHYSYTALACMFFLVHLLVSVSAERPLHCPACAPPRRLIVTPSWNTSSRSQSAPSWTRSSR